jgi:hypothetical protein
VNSKDDQDAMAKLSILVPARNRVPVTFSTIFWNVPPFNLNFSDMDLRYDMGL